MRSLAAFLLVSAFSLSACEPDPGMQRTVSPITMALTPSTGSDFWAAPWPLDSRRDADGYPDLSNFPNPVSNEFLDGYLTHAQQALRGFGLASPAWLPMSGPIDLPVWDWDLAGVSGRCEGPVRLLDVDPSSPDRGTCLPARWAVVPSLSADPFLAPDSIVVAPAWGFPRRSGRTYAIYIVDVRDADGAWVAAGATLWSALLGEGDPGLVAAYQPLAAMVAEDPSLAGELADPTWIAAATVFSTQDAVGEMQSLADFVRLDPNLPAWTGELTMIDSEHPEYQHEYDLWDGAYLAHNFQRGEIPYMNEGGGFVWDDEGAPIPQAEERIPFAVGMPAPIFTQPDSGWPVVLHQHGTGGDRWSHLTGGALRPGRMAAQRGFLSVAIPQPIHDERWPERTTWGLDLYSFNYFNPESGRSMFRQGALDLVTLHQFVVREFGPGGSISTAHPELRIDPDRIYFLGHSQGGLTGAIALPFVPEIKGWVLSGAGAGTGITLMQREDPFVIRESVFAAIGSPDGTDLNDLHPVVGLVQWLAEATDPISYAPLWNADPEHLTDILLTEGLNDVQTVADSTEALATAGRLPVARPYDERAVPALRLLEEDRIRTPYAGNVVGIGGSATTGLAQFDSDHFAIFQENEAALLWINFLYSHATFGGPGELGFEF